MIHKLMPQLPRLDWTLLGLYNTNLYMCVDTSTLSHMDSVRTNSRKPKRFHQDGPPSGGPSWYRSSIHQSKLFAVSNYFVWLSKFPETLLMANGIDTVERRSCFLFWPSFLIFGFITYEVLKAKKSEFDRFDLSVIFGIFCSWSWQMHLILRQKLPTSPWEEKDLFDLVLYTTARSNKGNLHIDWLTAYYAI